MITQGRPWAPGGGIQTLSHIRPARAGAKHSGGGKTQHLRVLSYGAVSPSARKPGCLSIHSRVCVLIFKFMDLLV